MSNDGRSLVTKETHLGILTIGNRRSGKTVLLERLNEKYHKGGFIICDWWSPRNYENLFYCIPKTKGKKSIPIVLIHPEYVDVRISDEYYDLITPLPDTHKLKDILNLCKDEKRICCFDNTSYDYDHSYEVVARLFKELVEVNKKHLNYDIVLSLREVSNLLFSHLKLSPHAEFTRKILLQTIREARHNNIVLNMDTQRFMGVYADSRDNIDVIAIKNSNPRIFPEKLHWFWNRIDRKYRNIKPQFFPQMMRSFPKINQMRNYEYYELWNDYEVPHPVKRSYMPSSFKHREEKTRDSFIQMTGTEYIYLEKEEPETNLMWKDRCIFAWRLLNKEGHTHQMIANAYNLKRESITKLLSKSQ